MYCIVVLARKKITKSQVLLNRDEMCRKNNVSFVELVDLYKLKLRQEMNEAYCSARDYPPSLVADLHQQNKGKRQALWTPQWRLYKNTIYRTAKDNVRKFENVAFPGIVFDARGGKRTKKNKNTAEAHSNQPNDNKREGRMANNKSATQVSINKMPLEITFNID